jgi:transcriptional regulator with XRE-family HTH domain
VPGLRREELAVLAGLSPDYYSRLEQGRQANISDEVLDALARALRLDEAERAHLHDLAAPTERRNVRTQAVQRPDAGLLRLMGALDHVPVLLLGHHGNVLARNALLPNQRLVVYTAQPDSPTARLLPILASWGTSTLASPEPGTSTAQP